MIHENQKILLVGDSLTQRAFDAAQMGWAAQLSNHFLRKCDIVARGFGGYTSRWMRQVLPKLVLPENVLCSVLFIGVNDSVLPQNTLQHVPLAEYRENLAILVKFLQQRGPVLVIAPTPLVVDDWTAFRALTQRPNDRSLESTHKYNQACLEVCAELNVTVADTWQQFSISSSEFVDGLHFAASGNTLVFNAVVAGLGKMGISAESLETLLPWHDNPDILKLFDQL